jgi:hypothetical protein
MRGGEGASAIIKFQLNLIDYLQLIILISISLFHRFPVQISKMAFAHSPIRPVAPSILSFSSKNQGLWSNKFLQPLPP